ncbi:response regulator [Paenibacillus sp. JX-17]|uniref:Response regulator n=1 Tax=Paenibacillus lacisoli TaxID=3064525 RepID=A0ABT9CI25_9BACL|nr:response regulator [Paenibacillus sp. JX-17]MDO7907587.1 response regulator [Paenibacillus sp. JX-17]
MNVLLVDDDYFVVSALEQKIDWKALSFEQVYTAYNIAQARGILQNHSVQILICDIEMPQGSGLELLAWIREEQYSIQTIFLTNYADFNYAQKAVELHSFDYFLKPIAFDKLTLIISKAAYQAREQQSNEQAIREGQLWKKNERKMVEHFWQKRIKAKSAADPASIALSIQEQNLSYQMTDLFLPVLIHLFPYDRSLGKEDKDLFDYAFLNVLSELFQHPSFSVETVLEHKDYSWVAILKGNESFDSSIMESICSSFIAKANQILKCDVATCMAASAWLESVHPVIRDLLNRNEEMVKQRNQNLWLDHHPLPEVSYTPPNLSLLEELLNQDLPDAFLEKTTQYLHTLVQGRVITASVLSQFRLDIVQLVYAYLKSKQIQAHKLYTGRVNDQLFIQSLNSIEDMEKYLIYLVNTAADYRQFTEQPQSVVEEIKQYIETHYGDDLTRTSLAEIVYLNPDYLARLFKKETGVSLGTFITQTRIQAAKRLLETTSLSVYAVASKVGYANYSYFSKVFKQDTGWTPNEYRKERDSSRLGGKRSSATS